MRKKWLVQMLWCEIPVNFFHSSCFSCYSCFGKKESVVVYVENLKNWHKSN